MKEEQNTEYLLTGSGLFTLWIKICKNGLELNDGLNWIDAVIEDPIMKHKHKRAVVRYLLSLIGSVWFWGLNVYFLKISF